MVWCSGHQVRQPNGILVCEGSREGTGERFTNELMQPQEGLGVQTYLGNSERYCWRLPQDKRR